jgi:AmmeMemoRadiSam system protein A
MNDTQKAILLKIAKDTIVAAVTKQRSAVPATGDSQLNAHCGCFVTIKNHGRLRGCIGQFTSDKPLVELVRDMAKASATGDSRFAFDRIRPKEFDMLDIEISVLSPLKKTGNPLSLRLGVDGIYIVKGCNSGCFLPQVATETGWSKEEFLSYCCEHKAGLEPDAWKDPSTEIYLFTADVFGKDFRDI